MKSKEAKARIKFNKLLEDIHKKRYFYCLCAPGSDHIERTGPSCSWGYFFTGYMPRGKCTLLQAEV